VYDSVLYQAEPEGTLPSPLATILTKNSHENIGQAQGRPRVACRGRRVAAGACYDEEFPEMGA
jgi:hypothetical protein